MFYLSTGKIFKPLLLIVTNVFVNSLVIVFERRETERKLKFHKTMPCICVQFYNSKALRSEYRNSTTIKMNLFVTITALSQRALS